MTSIITAFRVGNGLIVIGLAGLLLSWHIYTSQPRAPHITSVAVAAAPSAAKPNAPTLESYTVAPTLPKYITVPALKIVKTRIIGLGLEKNGQITTPGNIYDTGWYSASSRPGQPGAMFIYGHVSNWTANGVFYDLKKPKPGDEVMVTRGDNKTFIYQVIETKVYNYDNVPMDAVLSPVKPSTPGLNLMSCTGQIIKGTSEFNERLVVFTSLIPT